MQINKGPTLSMHKNSGKIQGGVKVKNLGWTHMASTGARAYYWDLGAPPKLETFQLLDTIGRCKFASFSLFCKLASQAANETAPLSDFSPSWRRGSVVRTSVYTAVGLSLIYA